MSGEATKPIAKDVLWGGGRSPFSVSYGKMMMWYFLVSDALTFSGLLIAVGVMRHKVTVPWPIGEQTFNAMPFLGSGYPLLYVALMTFILIISSVTMVLAVEAGHRNHKSGVVKWLAATVIGGLFFVGSQAWEWYHFIHGSGGNFLLNTEVVVTDDAGTSHTLPAGTAIFMDETFGHDYEHALESIHMAPVADAHDTHGHDAHATETADAHAHVHLADMQPSVLLLNKYTDGKASVSDAEALKLWQAKAAHSMTFGANLHANEYGPQVYADFFFFITGFHGFHVFSGVLINLIVLIMVMRGVMEKRKHYEMVEKVGLYWHFVDLVWVFVFTFFYLV